MGMDVGGSKKGAKADINITPLIDVVLVLLIIFMVVVPLLLKGYDVDMPRTPTVAPPVQAEELQVLLTIGPTGRVSPSPRPRSRR